MKPHARPGLTGSALCIAAAMLSLIAVAAAQDGPAPKGAADVGAAPKPAPATQPEIPQTGDKGAAAIRQTRPGTFELHVQDLDLGKVLKLLSTQGQKNIVAAKDVSGKVTADLYGVTFEEALDAVLNSLGYTYIKKDAFIYVMTAKQKQEWEQAQKKIEQETFRLSYITAKDAKAIIEPVMSKEGKITTTPDMAVGIATSSTDAGGNSCATSDVLVVYDYKENIEKVRKILAEVDHKPEQILIEATILTASLEEDNDLGLNFNTLAGIDFKDVGAVSPNLSSINSYNVSAASTGLPAATLKTSFPTVSNGLTFGFLGNNVAVFLTALEQVTDLTILANPKLLVMNKQRGEVLIGERQGYKTTTTTETAATESIEFLETGTRLVVRPFICKDGLIRMEIHPEESTGSISAEGLPNEETTEVTSNVLIRDGHTFVIGGLFREKTQAVRNQVPVLGNIPHLGVLFRQTQDETRRKEIIILVTPHIIQQDVDEAVSQQLKDDTERYRIGARNGLQWWGRARLVQSHLRWAKQALRDGDQEKALWDIDMALALDPRMEEAIRLKERLTEKAYWSEHSQVSSVRNLVERMISEELGQPTEAVSSPDKPRDADKIHPDARKALGIRKRTEGPIVKDEIAPTPRKKQDPAPAGKAGGN